MIIGETAGVPAIGLGEPEGTAARARASVGRGGVLRRYDWPLFGSAHWTAATRSTSSNGTC
jgi:hypothetical protein